MLSDSGIISNVSDSTGIPSSNDKSSGLIPNKRTGMFPLTSITWVSMREPVGKFAKELPALTNQIRLLSSSFKEVFPGDK